MNIIGHGIDLVEISEIRHWIEDPRNPLIPRCFSEEELKEISHGPGHVEHLAGRFAAKEAVLKALGRGFGNGIAFSDIIIHRAPGAPPEVHLKGVAAAVAAERGITEWQLSISHTGAAAVASAIAIDGISQDANSTDI